eukprot:ctg_6013.g850
MSWMPAGSDAAAATGGCARFAQTRKTPAPRDCSTSLLSRAVAPAGCASPHWPAPPWPMRRRWWP